MRVQARDYQQRIVDHVVQAVEESHKSVLIESPTGSGKTVMAHLVAQKLHEKANNIDDMLRKDVFEIAGSDDMGEKLWDKRFRNYQNKWDRLSKKVRRIQFK